LAGDVVVVVGAELDEDGAFEAELPGAVELAPGAPGADNGSASWVDWASRICRPASPL
jgi:hypothetical protein